jgi:hypothetical protein
MPRSRPSPSATSTPTGPETGNHVPTTKRQTCAGTTHVNVSVHACHRRRRTRHDHRRVESAHQRRLLPRPRRRLLHRTPTSPNQGTSPQSTRNTRIQRHSRTADRICGSQHQAASAVVVTRFSCQCHPCSKLLRQSPTGYKPSECPAHPGSCQSTPLDPGARRYRATPRSDPAATAPACAGRPAPPR